MNETSVRLPGIPDDYYAPDYRIEVEGYELDPETKGDLLDLKVSMDIDEMTGFEMTVNNWDDRHLEFKYSDKATFDVGRRVRVEMGYADRLVPLVHGLITTLTPRFPESGSPTLRVQGVDAMFCLKDRKPRRGETKKFRRRADWQIAQVIARRNGLRANVAREGEVHDLVWQKNQTDGHFIMERAKRIDFDCYIFTDPDSGRDTLHFLKPTDGRDGAATRVFELTWGQDLIEFNPTLTISGQVSEVEVRGWDPRTKSVIEYRATARDLLGERRRGESGPAAVARCLRSEQRKQEVVVDAPVTSRQEARELATSLLQERAYEFVTGSGRIIGLPDLRPGDNVQLDGLGERFQGLYYVKRVEHMINESGYLTEFEVRKVYAGEAEGS